MGLRFYIATDEGLRRISMKVVEERTALPQFAGTRQKMVQAVTERRNGQLFFSAHGSYISFTEDGFLHVPMESLRTVAQLVDAAQAIDRERRDSPKVTDVSLYRHHRQLRNEHRWELSETEREAIAEDLLGSERSEGASPIPLLRPQLD